jgi:hypothetical protein
VPHSMETGPRQLCDAVLQAAKNHRVEVRRRNSKIMASSIAMSTVLFGLPEKRALTSQT